MKYTISDVHRKKIAQATHSAGKIATVAQIALGTGGVDGSGNVKTPAGSATKLTQRSSEEHTQHPRRWTTPVMNTLLSLRKMNA